MQMAALGNEQAGALRPADGWSQQLPAVAGCDESPQSASVQLRTAGQSTRPRHGRGQSGTQGH